MEAPLSLAFVLQETTAVRDWTRQSRTRTLTTLLASSLILVLWFGLAFKGLEFLPRATFGALSTFPPLINACAWAALVVLESRLWRSWSYDRLERFHNVSGIDDPEVLHRYEAAQYALSRQRTVERVILQLVSLEFITIAALMAASMVGFRG